MSTKVQEEEAWHAWSEKVNPTLDRHGVRSAFRAGFVLGKEKEVPPRDAEKIGLPATPFFYTTDQVATMLQVGEHYVKTKLLHYTGRSMGAAPRKKIIATNLAPEGETPVWRILDKHLIKYLRTRGIKFQSMGYR